jgi:hypothetical protein
MEHRDAIGIPFCSYTRAAVFADTLVVKSSTLLDNALRDYAMPSICPSEILPNAESLASTIPGTVSMAFEISVCTCEVVASPMF